MRILVVSDEAWNDRSMPNGVLTNWFSGFDAEFANVYCSPGLPRNQICKKYFRVTDTEMVKSIFGIKRAGTVVEEMETMPIAVSSGYSLLKRLSQIAYSPMMMLRDIIWFTGRYDVDGLREFINDFNPDVVFCARLATPKLMRLEKLISTLANAPMVAFTGDDETKKYQHSASPLYRLRKCLIQRMFRRTVGIYSKYLTHSPDQARDYNIDYGIDTGILLKCGDLQDSLSEKPPFEFPLKIVYAGKLYCNRWRTLELCAEVIGRINVKMGEKVVFHVFSSDKNRAFERFDFVKIHNEVSPNELQAIFFEADLLLHVEQLSKPDCDAVRVSFSTKVVDMIFSQTAIMAICDSSQAAFRFLKENDSAFCASSAEEIEAHLSAIIENPALLQEYRLRAYNLSKSLDRKNIQQNLLGFFNKAIEEYRLKRK